MNRSDAYLIFGIAAVLVGIWAGLTSIDNPNEFDLVATIKPGDNQRYASVKIDAIPNQTISTGYQKETKIWADGIFANPQYVNVSGIIPGGVFVVYVPEGQIICNDGGCIITAEIIGIYRPKKTYL